MKENKGITLIALIVTIIVLIILAGISVNLLLGENGLIQRAKDAKVVQEEAEVITRIKLDILAKQIENEGSLSASDIESILDTYGDVEKSGDEIISIKPDGKDYIIPYEEISKDIVNEGPKDEGPQGVAFSIGDTVNYSTSLNGVILDNWKVFYVEGNYTYLIYGDDCLPNSTINTDNLTGIMIPDEDPYSVRASDDRDQLLNAMTTTSNWSSLLVGTVNGKNVNETTNANAWAMGSPTIELWINSWNTSFPEHQLPLNYIEGENYSGWIVSEEIDPESGNINPYSGNNNKFIDILELDTTIPNWDQYLSLYVSEHDEDEEYANMMGYWLASPLANDSYDGFICSVIFIYGGRINYLDSSIEPSYGSNGFSFRPVIKLPTSVLN